MPGIRGSWFILALCLTAAPAGAQTIAAPTHEDYGSIAEVGLGGSIVSLPEASAAQTVPEFGASALGGVYPRDTIGIAGELTAYTHGRAALAGVRLRTGLNTSGTTHWRLFAQMLGGPQWTDGLRQRVLQAGVGADDYLSNGAVVHVQYDYTFAPGDDRGRSTGRFLVGVGMRLGHL